MIAKKFAGAAAVAALIAGVTVPALAAEVAPEEDPAVKAAQLDVDLYCTESAESYNAAQCAMATEKLEALKAGAAEAEEGAAGDAEENEAAPVGENNGQAAAGDTVKEMIKDVDLDSQYFCAEGTEYFDHVKCGELMGKQADLEKRDAELDVLYFCTEGTEYFDHIKCGEAQAKLAGDKTPSTEQTETPAPEDKPQSMDKSQSGDKAKPEVKKDGKLAKTGAETGLLAGIAALAAGAGAVALVARKRS